MLRTLFLLCSCTLASAVPCIKPNELHGLHETYSRSLMLAHAIHQDVLNLLAPYEEQLGINGSQVPNLFMSGLPSCAVNYIDWLSLEDAARLQQDSEYLQLFNRHIDACCSSKLQLGAEYSLPLELLQLNIRDLQVQITEQLKLLQQPAVYTAASPPAPLCNRESLWVSRMQGYIVLRGLEKCVQKVVRDYTRLRSQQQQQ
ncbi:cardiotrophin-2-like [Anguilla rostrata]|uniref:cardiotrophin-2-like n=1 Tax=Anguilla rostrata TaxID=7938 RepID=UPI0030CAC51C